MRNAIVFTLLLVVCGTLSGPGIAVAQEINEHLEPFLPYLGKTFRGEMGNSTPENPVFDVQHTELALKGQAVRIRHSINDGVYGGETLVVWDKEQGSLVYFYFTTAGFYTTGTMSHTDGVFTSIEHVKGNEGGVTQVKARSWIREDGGLESSSEYLKNGEWVAGHAAVYYEDPEAEVILR